MFRLVWTGLAWTLTGLGLCGHRSRITVPGIPYRLGSSGDAMHSAVEDSDICDLQPDLHPDSDLGPRRHTGFFRILLDRDVAHVLIVSASFLGIHI
jgi:hypothetical protein